MQRKLIVFISSCMNTRKDDLSKERQTVIKCIEELEYLEPRSLSMNLHRVAM